MSKVAYLIPAYQPDHRLVELVSQLRAMTDAPIVVVDDGSAPETEPTFTEVAKVKGTVVARHAVNLGKGAALKTAFNEALTHHPDLTGAVTLDADGQHRPEDAISVAKASLDQPETLVLGCRQFDMAAHKVPLRSRLGNILTRLLFRLITGVKVSDTQTGLRGIPTPLMRAMLHVPTTGYDFETDMLIHAVRHRVRIKEVPISTVYIDDNKKSHFNPFLDSIRIYFVFFRFVLTSLVTSAIDFVAFFLTYWLCGNLLVSLIMGRLIAATFNFVVSKRVVFRSSGQAWIEALRYVLLVIFLLVLSNVTISAVVKYWGINVYWAKILVETSLFLVSFSVQRLMVFASNSTNESPAELTL